MEAWALFGSRRLYATAVVCKWLTQRVDQKDQRAGEREVARAKEEDTATISALANLTRNARNKLVDYRLALIDPRDGA
jgi:hypothetical protein